MCLESFLYLAILLLCIVCVLVLKGNQSIFVSGINNLMAWRNTKAKELVRQYLHIYWVLIMECYC